MTLDLSVGADWSEQYIDGEWNPSQSRETIVVEDPSTHEAIATVPASVEADVNAAYEAATEAQTE